MNSFEKFNEEKLPAKKCFYSFDMKSIGDYHDHYFKKRCIVIS